MKPGDTTTIDLMYSYEQQRVPFKEDTINRMSIKLKDIKNTEGFDEEENSNIQSFLQVLNTIETNHADYYSQR